MEEHAYILSHLISIFQTRHPELTSPLTSRLPELHEWRPPDAATRACAWVNDDQQSVGIRTVRAASSLYSLLNL